MPLDTTVPRSRRSLLAAVGAALTGAAAATLAGAQAVLADGDDGRPLTVASTWLDVRNDTILENKANGNGVFYARSRRNGTAIRGISFTGTGMHGASTSGHGIYGESESSVGVFGNATGSGTGVAGRSVSGYGVYGYGESLQGVKGTSRSYIGVSGGSYSKDYPGVLGWSREGNTGVQGVCGGYSPPTTPAHTGVFGTANDVAAAVGVRGVSWTGRGAVFTGKLAQLRLQPSDDATHPASGQAGDLFFDGSHRLWLCLGTTNWKRVQLA